MIQKIFSGAKKGLPIGIAYIPFAFTFGFIATNANISVFKSSIMSFILYAGNSQVIIVKLLQNNTNLFQIILAAVIVNIRYALINMPIIKKQQREPLGLKILNCLFLTDECVSYMLINKIFDIYETIGFAICAYLFFGISSICGSILGQFIPPLYTKSLNFVLYAIFLYLLTQVISKNYKYIIIVLITLIIKIIFTYLAFSSSIAMLLSIIFGALIPTIVGVNINE